jgi:hypothetical protein
MFYRDEVVEMMTNHINTMNRNVLFRLDMPEEQINETLAQMQDELNRVNGELYDMLKENGVIA